MTTVVVATTRLVVVVVACVTATTTNDTSSDSDNSERKSNGKKGMCYNYGVRGHFANECRIPKKEEAILPAGDDELCLL